MSVDLISDDFGTGAALTTPWVSILGAGFTSDGFKVSPDTTGGSEDQSTLTTIFTPSTPTSLEYELDVIAPATWPPAAGTQWKQGVTLFQQTLGRRGIAYTIERNTTGPTYFAKLMLRPTASASDVTLASTAITALVAGQTYRLKVQVTVAATLITVLGYIDGVLTAAVQVTIAQFNLVTGQTLTTYANATKYPGLLAKIDGTVAGYFDRLRVRDISAAATQPDTVPVYTLTAAASLTPITLSAEDNSTGDTLTVQPDAFMQPDDQWGGLATLYDSGHVQTQATQTVPRRKWPMTWTNISQTDRDTLVALHAAVTGRKKAFSWTDPETATTIKLKFVGPMNSPMTTRGGASGGRVYALSTEVEEVLT